MIAFPIIYIIAFCTAVYHICRSRPDRVLLFIIFGLPIYITALSITAMYGIYNAVPVLQSFKEISVILAFIATVFSLRKKPQLLLIDKVVIGFFGYALLYTLLPLGGYSFMERLIALKSMAFFPLIYFTGRLIDINKVNIGKYFHFICLIAIPTAAIVIWEVINYSHFQLSTGYADFMFRYFGVEPSGNFGLSWTFEAESNGLKRFASIYSNPLDHAAGTLVTICAITALITTDSKKIKPTPFLTLAFLCSLCSIFFALSRASFASYFIILYVYAYITGRRKWLVLFHYAVILAGIIVFTLIEGDILQFIINTINFTNSSSLSHIIEWLDGLQAMSSHPLGMGMGASGRVSAMQGLNIGGENQFIIIGVQVGLAALAAYLFIYVSLLRTGVIMAIKQKGKARKTAIFVLLLKLGMIIPFLTAEAESYVYVSYVTWFFSGLMMNIREKTRLTVKQLTKN